ncbi:hypothetical protein BGW42_002226 [Actinomortierella wolfii]|nr:hypothetical protein BGW42_002226 [Actinomortierella wolfii]
MKTTRPSNLRFTNCRKHGFELFCLGEGEATSDAFPVSVSPITIIGELKKPIMVKMANNFQDDDVNMLTLWRVLIPNNMQNTVVTLDKDKPVDKTGLTDPRARLSTLIPEVPDDNTFIFVQRLPHDICDS